MLRLKTYLFLKYLAIQKWLYEGIRQPIIKFYSYLTHYQPNPVWMIHEHHTLPYSHVIKPIDGSRTYHESTNVLSYGNHTEMVRTSWLSVKLVIVNQNKSHEFDIDPFLETLRIHTLPIHPPTLTDLYLAWCAHSKQWFSNTAIVQFHVIDHEGNERMLTRRSDDTCLEIRNGKVYDRVIKDRGVINYDFSTLHYS